MEIVGWVFIGILVLITMLGVVTGLMSFPDARRYMKIRRM